MKSRDEEANLRTSEAAIDVFLMKYGSRLLDRDTFVQRTLELLDQKIMPSASQAALQVYSEALYHACSGSQGRQRQELGYSELSACLSRYAYARYRYGGEDVTQQALEVIYSRFDSCRQPSTFLAFALQKLRDACRAAHRQAAGSPQSLDSLCDDGFQPLDPDAGATTAADPVEQVLTRELRQRLIQAMREFVLQHPRAVHQVAVVWWKYIDGLDDRAISRRLGKPIASVHVLRSRALAKLRNDPAWRDLALELGLAGAH